MINEVHICLYISVQHHSLSVSVCVSVSLPVCTVPRCSCERSALKEKVVFPSLKNEDVFGKLLDKHPREL